MIIAGLISVLTIRKFQKLHVSAANTDVKPDRFCPSYSGSLGSIEPMSFVAFTRK